MGPLAPKKAGMAVAVTGVSAMTEKISKYFKMGALFWGQVFQSQLN